MKTSFIFYLEWVEQLEVMAQNGGNISDLFVAIKQYLEIGEVQFELDPLAQLTFNQFRSQIDRDADRYEEVSEKRRKAAEKRWKNGKSGEQTDASVCKPMQTDANGCKEVQTHPYMNKDDEDDDDRYTSISNNNLPLTPSLLPAPKTTRFIPPTLDEVAEYCRQRGNNVDPVAFFNFYDAKGWMVGKNKMKKWKSAVITWERNRNGGKGSSRPTVEDIMTTPYYTFGEVTDDR